METEKKRKKGGNDYLKEKIVRLEAENAVLKEQVENAKYFGSIIDSLLGAMGFIRRAIWLYKHREELERNGR